MIKTRRGEIIGSGGVVLTAVDGGYLNAAQVLTIFPITPMTLHRWMNNPKVAFPRPVKLAAGATARNFWRVADIRAWQQARESESDPPAAA